jgi:hypothetical protein
VVRNLNGSARGRAALGKLDADGVSEPVPGDRRTALNVTDSAVSQAVVPSVSDWNPTSRSATQ